MSQQRPDTILRLTTVFRDVFESETLELNEQLGPKDVAGWDSLAHVRLVVAIEEEFNVRFTTREIASFKCVNDVMKVVSRAA